MNHRYIQ